jgi:hypothetical protein
LVREAERSKWVMQMLPNMNYINGMCMYLTSKHPNTYDKVGQIYSLKTQKRLKTNKTLAIASKVGLVQSQLETLRAWMKVEGVILELNSGSQED